VLYIWPQTLILSHSSPELPGSLITICEIKPTSEHDVSFRS